MNAKKSAIQRDESPPVVPSIGQVHIRDPEFDDRRGCTNSLRPERAPAHPSHQVRREKKAAITWLGKVMNASRDSLASSCSTGSPRQMPSLAIKLSTPGSRKCPPGTFDWLAAEIPGAVITRRPRQKQRRVLLSRKPYWGGGLPRL